MPTIEWRGPFDCAEAGKKQVRQIASSIQRFGFTNPVLQTSVEQSSPIDTRTGPTRTSQTCRLSRTGQYKVCDSELSGFFVLVGKRRKNFRGSRRCRPD